MMKYRPALISQQSTWPYLLLSHIFIDIMRHRYALVCHQPLVAHDHPHFCGPARKFRSGASHCSCSWASALAMPWAAGCRWTLLQGCLCGRMCHPSHHALACSHAGILSERNSHDRGFVRIHQGLLRSAGCLLRAMIPLQASPCCTAFSTKKPRNPPELAQAPHRPPADYNW